MATTNNRIANQGVWIGDGPLDFNETTLFLGGQLGMVYTKAGKTYQLVKMHSGASSPILGDAVAWQDHDDFVVTDDISDAKRNAPAGICQDTVTAGNHCWIQVAGPATVYF